MNILGIDPGATTGWCVYDSDARRVLEAGHFPGHDEPFDSAFVSRWRISRVAIEQPKGYGPTFPQLVDAGIVFGRLIERWTWRTGFEVEALLRLEVCRRIQAAVHGVFTVRDDATAWAAMLELHGGAEAGAKPKTKKGKTVEPGGPLGLVTGHARTALAVAYASLLPASEPVMAKGAF